ncbi:DUF3035 domain-containing protein [Roseobacteraceae bacterium S113]
MMTRRPMLIMAALGLVMLTSACARDITLREVRNAGEGPEEFGIVPTKPLELPENLSALPQPTPGASNRSDQRPLEDAVAALGGNPNRVREQGGVPAGDGALIATASRFGRTGNIRESLAEEDLAFRKRKSLFSFKVVPTDEYNDAYRRERLDPYGELERFRRAGIRTPAAPPEGTFR